MVLESKIFPSWAPTQISHMKGSPIVILHSFKTHNILDTQVAWKKEEAMQMVGQNNFKHEVSS